tara:strand:- start:9372 stop:10247 length:876 start_codon:yes stop_codon:yes gene_type:complete
MALSAPRSLFGIHSVSPYSRTDGTFFGELRVLENSSLSLSGETIDLLGGSNKFPWEAADGAITAEMSLAFSEYPDFVFELFLGNAPTTNAAEAGGSVSGFANVKGTTVKDAANGIDVVELTAGDTADLKFGKYIIKATAAQTFDVFLSSDIDMGRGTDGSYLSDNLKIATGLSVSSGDAVEATFGLTFSKVGTPAFTTGDTAEFYIRPINSSSMDVTIGATANQTFPNFGAVLYAQKKGDGQMLEIDAFNCKAVGMPINLQRNAFSAAEVTVKMLYDSAKDGVFKIRFVDA